MPPEHLAPAFLVDTNMAIEIYVIRYLRPFDFPWVSKVKPVIWLLMLKSVFNSLHTRPDSQNCQFLQDK